MLLLFALAAGAANNDQVMPPLASGPFPVACSNLAQDGNAMNQIGGLPADFWEGIPQNGQTRYISQILAEPQTAIRFSLHIPADRGLYPQFADSTLPFVTLVCYPTSPKNTRPDYSLPDGRVIPHMERPGESPMLPDSGTTYPLLVYSHSLGGSPLGDSHLSIIVDLASYGYIVMAVFHADARIAPIRVTDLGDVIYLFSNLDHYVELQALRPLAFSVALDDLLARPGYGDRINRRKIGAFGASLGGESVLLSMGAWLTSNIRLDSRPAAQDARIKAAVGYVPYSGQRLLPAFGDDQNGAYYVTRPFLAIGGTADTTAPLFMTEQAVNHMQGSHYVVALTDVGHQYLPEYRSDVFGWVIPFLDAYVKNDGQALSRFAQTQSIVGGVDDLLLVNYTKPPSPQDIFVQVPLGSTITINVELSDTIDNVKVKIQDQTGIPVALQTLSLGGVVMADGQTLADYSVLKGSTLILSLPPVTSVPTLSEWGLVMLVSLIGLIGLVRTSTRSGHLRA